MSPAKRLSRKRFRALCERCRAWCDPRTKRFLETLVIANKRDGTPYPNARARRTITALARLAR